MVNLGTKRKNCTLLNASSTCLSLIRHIIRNFTSCRLKLLFFLKYCKRNQLLNVYVIHNPIYPGTRKIKFQTPKLYTFSCVIYMCEYYSIYFQDFGFAKAQTTILTQILQKKSIVECACFL